MSVITPCRHAAERTYVPVQRSERSTFPHTIGRVHIIGQCDLHVEVLSMTYPIWPLNMARPNTVPVKRPGGAGTHTQTTVCIAQTTLSSNIPGTFACLFTGTFGWYRIQGTIGTVPVPSFRRPPSSRRGEALWERAEAGSGLLGAASSESAAGLSLIHISEPTRPY